jgi:hypothetical protein
MWKMGYVPQYTFASWCYHGQIAELCIPPYIPSWVYEMKVAVWIVFYILTLLGLCSRTLDCYFRHLARKSQQAGLSHTTRFEDTPPSWCRPHTRPPHTLLHRPRHQPSTSKDTNDRDITNARLTPETQAQTREKESKDGLTDGCGEMVRQGERIYVAHQPLHRDSSPIGRRATEQQPRMHNHNLTGLPMGRRPLHSRRATSASSHQRHDKGRRQSLLLRIPST